MPGSSLAVMYTLGLDIIHSAISGIITVTTGPETRKWRFPSDMADIGRTRERKSLFFPFKKMTVELEVGFHIDDHFEIKLFLCCKPVLKFIHKHRTAPTPSSPQQRELRERETAASHADEPNDCLHCWNSGLASCVYPHLANSQYTVFSRLSLSFLLSRSYGTSIVALLFPVPQTVLHFSKCL